jgi:hypothetical protein
MTSTGEEPMFTEADVISKYTTDEATEDGWLLELAILKDKLTGVDSPRCPFSHVTVNLLKKLGYMTETYDDFCGHTKTNVLTGQKYRCRIRECPECYEKKGEIKFNYPNMLDLLNQATQVFKRGIAKQGEDWHYEGRIETPSGKKQLIYINLNDKRRFTILLPEDN